MMLGGLVLVVLLTLIVACANVTNLLLGLSTSRRHEMLVRAALGASRVQLVVPLLRESLLLGLVAAAIGYVAGYTILAKVAAFTPSLGGFWPAPTMDLRPDAVVFAATLLVAIAVGLGVGLTPALRAASDGLAGSINRELGAGEPRKARIRQVLVVIQMAVATVVLVGVGVSIRSFINLGEVPLGFSARHLMFTGVDLRRSGFDARTGQCSTSGCARLSRRCRTSKPSHLQTRRRCSGFRTTRSRPKASHRPRTATALRRRFRSWTRPTSRPWHRRPSRPHVPLPRQGRQPRGRRHQCDDGPAALARRGSDRPGAADRERQPSRPRHRGRPDGKFEEITESQLPFMYFSLAQHYLPDITVIARPRRFATLARDAITVALADMHPKIVFGGIGVMTLDDLLEISLVLPRTIVGVNLVFGVLTLALAIFGLYSTVFYSVSQRTKEMGIRTALGAQPRDIFTLVLRQTGWVAVTGAALGVASGMALLPFASAIFYGIGPAEPIVIGVVSLASTTVALSTTYAVARQWMGLSSIEMLRQ